MPLRATLIPGDGIGPEVVEATRRALAATGVDLEWEAHEVGAAVAERAGGDPVPPAVLDSIRRNGVALKGPISTPAGGGFRSANIALRRSLDLFVQVRPCRTYPGVPSRFPAVDLVVMRETTEDLYAGIELERGTAPARRLVGWLAGEGHSIHPEAGISIKPISEEAARRVFRFAFDYARRNGRRKVSAVHKATVMKHTDGLFLAAARDVAAENPDVAFDDVLVDNLAGRLVQRPEEYDVLVMPNLYGDIVSDLAAGLIGGVGLAPGANYGPAAALFEPSHGTAPKHAGRNRANPMAAMLSGAMLLRHVGENAAADRLETAIADVIAEGRSVTYDLKGGDDPAAGTSDVADAVVARLAEQLP